MSDINELFSRDPLMLTDDDVDQIIHEMRMKRHLFNSAPVAKTAEKSLTKSQASALKLDIDLDL